ncbi:dihydroneopterin aldolase [Sulfitobacter sp. KE34]|uniref:dihydroneopterin aldolase n=1 Tax=Sulfitobacter faviae TaxID=1775881 RepID=A0AAX3LM95_9RHOB|nr:MULTISPECIES: dihydroneopterin aldolase [Sulfitobacter]MDF3349063.1 dihydroneopterin aldolase [Sulfitobacter sp. KE12]MDF3352734.1 dihydroneopterin aldolase [Sulfitobacter sp. KE27]MDF3356381.1 dihydroneopterin aldolase [Sulfitobacter sp. KE33]MDF3360810.1 dihydroneopterin aldolase [Sulfitobacter sp. Ks41]MDF3363805.1 dihydroneopterin aldolase [Sulfitobacter sp. Ks34]
MSDDEIRLAFAHPSERAETMAGPEPRDRISLRDHIVEVEIGAFQAERDVTQRVCFNVVVEVAPLTGVVDDDVDRILSYDRVTEAIAAELAAERLNLLETLAERVADRILIEPQAMRVFVRIEKLDRGPGALGVEIVRAREEAAAHDAAQKSPQPRVVYLSNAAIASTRLAEWLDQLEGAAEPVILCVGPPDTPLPQAEDEKAQRHIDLLAIEQNAWMLSTRDPRGAVVGSRTELDWATKNGQISIWAPARIVLDAVDGPAAPPSAAPALAAWFAESSSACELVLIGAERPEGTALPMRLIDVDSAEIV